MRRTSFGGNLFRPPVPSMPIVERQNDRLRFRGTDEKLVGEFFDGCTADGLIVSDQ